MKASLELRAVAYDDLAAAPETARMATGRKAAMRRAQTIKAKAWVARITQTLNGRQRQFLQAKFDARQDGAWMYYTLESGHVYEVNSPTGPWHAERYFCRVADDGAIVRIDAQDVVTWL